jgi:DNA invertase Pin-like site-specific DNA recombinase
MRAAQYLRMSTEHQQYSIQNQQAAIAEYAERRGFEVVKTYADPAKSGLNLSGRPGLRRLLADVVTGKCEYSIVLVYDISRWGRFQDADESAYYEFLCKKAGVRVHYCAEPFNNDEGSTMAVLFKSMKRAMAGEYLRELSHKVFIGQCRIAGLGHKLGGAPGYGLRRRAIASDGTEKGILGHKEWKAVSSDRIAYILGPPEETAVVREIFEWFVNEELPASRIVERLNQRGVSRSPYKKWSKSVVLDLLKNPKYIGCMVYNRISKKLGARETPNPADQWIVRPGRFPATIPTELFYAAQRRFVRLKDFSDRDLLEQLRRVLAANGRLSSAIIDDDPDVPSYQYFVHRFGNLGNTYRLLGYNGADGYVAGGRGAHYFKFVRNQIQGDLANALRNLHQSCHTWDRYIEIDGIGLLRIAIATVKRQNKRRLRWEVRIHDHSITQDLFVVRIDEDYRSVIDYLRLQLPGRQSTLAIDRELARIARLGETIFEAASALIASRRGGA